MRTPPVSVGEILELSPDGLVAGGEAICRVDGFPLFVPRIYRGDVAQIEVVEVKRGFGRGQVIELVSASPQRRRDPCPVAGECGGCDWAELRLDAQLDAKKEIVLDSLRRIGKFDPGALPSIRLHASPLNYRLRSRLHADPSDPGSVGFYARKSNDVVPISERCEVIGPALLGNLDALRNVARGGAVIDAFESSHAFSYAARPDDDTKGVPVALEVGSRTYTLSTTTFFQVNRHLLGRLIALVSAHAAESAGRELALDLYGGVGFFALPLAERFARVVTVEALGEAHIYAGLNCRATPNVAVVGAPVEEFLEAFEEQADFALADPPRAGLTPRALDLLARAAPPKICYLSCDPVTFSRDAAELGRRGYALRSLDLLDLFPNTHHVETLSLLALEQ
ncbi:MAG: class I SAM-dependent RNA methyltransferase [Acidobacteria bacterium]|nr:class I SAM-dependent RNA methyltransferase [Acidobacteriota bacterium]